MFRVDLIIPYKDNPNFLIKILRCLKILHEKQEVHFSCHVCGHEKKLLNQRYGYWHYRDLHELCEHCGNIKRLSNNNILLYPI
jgi:ssDNA-binding Zn-finger/Zn-ribbon topoisomerase 1